MSNAIPNDYDALSALCAQLLSRGQNREALDAADRAAGLRPDLPAAWSNLGFCLLANNDLARAEAALRRAIELDPKLANAHANLGNVLQRQVRPAEALECFRAAVALDPRLRVAHENLLLAHGYVTDLLPQETLAEHVRWAKRHADPLGVAARPHPNDRNPDRRLRVGYVSPDLYRHSVSFFLEPLLAAHDRASVEVFCYSDVKQPDETTARLKSLADTWRDCTGLTDEALAQQIRDDAIDILVDLAGHTAGNRLLVFARRPAPVLISYLGYPNTTGLSAIGYRITDAQADPPGVTDAHFIEELIRLPRCAWCYRAPEETPSAVAPPPSAASGVITFGSFNKLAKISPPTLDAWQRLLHRVPTARLLIKSRNLSDADMRMRLVDAFAGRVEFLGADHTLADHLAAYARVDIALDPFPYHGTTTTCDALYNGVPVITLAGPTHISRVGVSLIHAVGLDDLIADTPAAYVDIAARLAADPARLASLRAELRPRMAASPLMDAAGLARAIESAYRQAWRAWCTTR